LLTQFIPIGGRTTTTARLPALLYGVLSQHNSSPAAHTKKSRNHLLLLLLLLLLVLCSAEATTTTTSSGSSVCKCCFHTRCFLPHGCFRKDICGKSYW